MAHAGHRLILLALLVAPAATQGMTWTSFPGTAAGTPIGDVTGDGRDDLLTISQIGATDWIHRVFDSASGTELLFLQRPASLAPFPYPNYRAVGDFDGDGKDDLAYTDASQSCTILSGNDGSTLLSLGPVSDMGGAADFDGDGIPDFMYAMKVRSGRTGATLFQQIPMPGLGSFRIRPAGDVNGDGYDDATSASSGPSSAPMYLVAGPTGAVSNGPYANASTIGDVTGDGKVDLLAQVGLPLAWVILANGSYPPVWTLPAQAGVMRMGDVDGDGFGDLGVRIHGNPLTYQALSGATHAPLPGVPMNADTFWLGDLDGDGRDECSMAGALYAWSDPSLPVASRMLRRGTKGTTSDGRRPTIVTRGHCGLGRTAFFDLRGGMPNGLTLLVYGDNATADLTPLGAPGNFSYTTITGGYALATDSNGVASFPVTMPSSPILLGAALSLQALAVDPAANALGLVTSNAIDVLTTN